MSSFLQNFVAIALVLVCVAYVAWQLAKTVRAGTGKAGACCAKGCGGAETSPKSTPREQFIPSDALRRPRPRA